MGNLVKVLEDVASKRKQLTEEVKAVLAEGIKEFMVEHPVIKALSWTQYTPYFNDGDTCEFHVGDIYYSTSDARSDSFWDEEEGGWNPVSPYYRNKLPKGVAKQDFEELLVFAKALSDAEEDLQAAFGDHVKVLVTQQGIDVEEYDHD